MWIFVKEFFVIAYRTSKNIYRVLQRLGSCSNTSREQLLNIARSPSGSGFPKPITIARMPVTPLSEMNIARAPGKVEVLRQTAQALPIQTQDPAPVIEVQPVNEALITRDEDFF
jgi:hypothetical protein